MATKFVHLLSLQRFLLSPPKIRNPLKKSVVLAEKPVSAYVCRRKIVARNVQITRVMEYAHSFCRCATVSSCYTRAIMRI